MIDSNYCRIFKVAAGYAASALLVACSSAPPPPHDTSVPVAVAKVVRKSMPELITAVGAVEAINSVALKSLVDGQLLESHVKDGEEVKAGQLLFKIDPRPAQAALAQSQAALAKDEAARDLAKAQVDRYRPVADKGFISADQMQQYLTAYSAAAASVKVDQANVASANLTLGYTDIYAPISGRAGRILVQAGNLVKANDSNALIVLNQISPIFVNFAVPGRLVDRVRTAQAEAVLDVRAASDGATPAESGQLAFVDNAVDPATNTVKLRAAFTNADQHLWPGQFVNITLVIGNEADAIVVPDAAVKAGPNGNYVFVVKADNSAEQRAVSVARTVASEAVIEKGLNAGENVVTDGQSRLVDGTKVKPVDQTAAK
ncbi:MAG TPA: efflux RND transporter periplasmic adaptor subunit [Rudaea sp.]|jgi:multidrug efflux system membrane fusion protein|nr:efflux RND transporter periplasmic adaptor subunit [Rudaea sp.]